MQSASGSSLVLIFQIFFLGFRCLIRLVLLYELVFVRRLGVFLEPSRQPAALRCWWVALKFCHATDVLRSRSFRSLTSLVRHYVVAVISITRTSRSTPARCLSPCSLTAPVHSSISEGSAVIYILFEFCSAFMKLISCISHMTLKLI